MRILRCAIVAALALVGPARAALAQAITERSARQEQAVAPSTQTFPEGIGRLSPEGEVVADPLALLKQTPQPGQGGPVDPMTYQLGPGDLLELDLWGRLAKSVLLEVSPEGKIFLSGSGSIDVAGRTLAETRSRVLELVGRTFRGVRAELRLVRLRTIKVYVSGSVTKPGAYDATPVMRASEAVALAGTEKESSRRNITIRHRDGSASRLDLALFESTGDPRANPFLLDGDVVIVPLRTTLVEIGGAVMRPERFEWAPGDSLATLLRLAGGPLPSAARDRMLLVRFHGAARRDSIWLDGERVLDGSENPELADGDRFFVYFVADWHQLPAVEVYGEVNRPGTYPIVVGRDRLSDLLRWADGLSPRANRSAVHLLRPLEGVRETDPEFERLVRLSRAEMTESEYAVFQTKLSERRNSFRVDLDRIERDGAEVDPLLRETDIIRVDPIVHSVRVEGQVRRPGLVEYLPGRSVEDYVRLAGGYTNRASKSTVRVSRSVTGQVFPAKGVSAIQLGDFIWVPERRDIDAWAIFRDIVALAGQVAVIVVAVQGR